LMRRALTERQIVGAEADGWVPLLRDDLERYLRSSLFAEVRQAEAVQSEMMFRLTLGRHEITGVVDKVIRQSDGTAKVIDFKTNRVAKGQLAQTVEKYEVQLQLYALVVQRLLGWPVEQAVLYFTALGRTEEVDVSPARLAALEERLLAAFELIAATPGMEAFERTTDEEACRHCGYRMICKGE
jgi:ATP-dependent helicase/nuclease subunit A